MAQQLEFRMIGSTWTDTRIDGEECIAEGALGWPDYPEGVPSTIEWTSRTMDGERDGPRRKEHRIPRVFKGTMGRLVRAIRDDAEPETSGRTTFATMAEAANRSGRDGRDVTPSATMPGLVAL
jgi:hypothetical protein